MALVANEVTCVSALKARGGIRKIKEDQGHETQLTDNYFTEIDRPADTLLLEGRGMSS